MLYSQLHTTSHCLGNWSFHQNLQCIQQGSQLCRDGCPGRGLDLYICYPGLLGSCTQKEQRPVCEILTRNFQGNQRFLVCIKAFGVILGQKVEVENIRWGSKGGQSRTIPSLGVFRAFFWYSSSPVVCGGLVGLKLSVGLGAKLLNSKSFWLVKWYLGWITSKFQSAVTCSNFASFYDFDSI